MPNGVIKEMEDDMSDLDIATKCGAELTGKPDGSEAVSVVFTPLAWRTFTAEIRREQDKEIEQLKATLYKYRIEAQTIVDYNDQLQAKLAMMSEALQSATYCLDYSNKTVEDALSDTEQDVSAWRREVEAKAIDEYIKYHLDKEYIEIANKEFK